MISTAVGIVAFQLASGLFVTDQNTHALTHLSNADFTTGTYRIQASGRYELAEDIVFDPTYNAATMSWSKFPVDSGTYPHNGGYFLGFFAAMTVEADDVVIDCMGHSLSMSPAYHRMQRYFSLIEMASSPFTPTGPPPFYNPNKLPATTVNPGRVVIENCRLGLTSHYAIHGSGNTQLTMRHLKIYDFEGGGIEISGAAATKVAVEYCEIGPSLAETYSSYLYQAMIMDHLVNTLMPEEPEMEDLAASTSVKIRGEAPVKARGWFDKLRTALQTYMENSTGPMAAVAGDGKDLPDAAAVYGILLHTELAHEGTLQDLFCPDNFLCDPVPESQRLQDVLLKHLVIKNLSVKVNQRTRVVYHKGALVGVTGDVFPMSETWDIDNCYHYVGNVLTDAQAAAGKLSARARKKGGQLPEATVARYLGKSYISSYIRQWVAHEMECKDSGDLVLKIWKGAVRSQTKQNFTCTGDAYDCRNIGAVGIRLDFVKNVEVLNVTLGNFTNHGTENGAPFCSLDEYEGRDVRGMSTTFVSNLSAVELTQRGTLVSVDGGADRAFPFVTPIDPVSLR